MSKYRVPTDEEAAILRRNGVDPERFAVEYAEEGMIVLLNYKTRDNVIVREGDKKW